MSERSTPPIAVLAALAALAPRHHPRRRQRPQRAGGREHVAQRRIAGLLDGDGGSAGRHQDARQQIVTAEEELGRVDQFVDWCALGICQRPGQADDTGIGD